MKSNNGLAPAEQLRPLICEQSPGKKQFASMADAQAQADYDNRKYDSHHVAYACPSCGLFHVTSKVLYGDVIRVHPDGRVVTAAMATRAAKRARGIDRPTLERIDVSEIIAHETPLVPSNRAAREKLLTEHLATRQVTTMAEVTTLLHVTPQYGGDMMRAFGWKAVVGNGGSRWIPGDADPLDTDEDHQKLLAFLGTRTSTTVKAVMDRFKISEQTAKKWLIRANWGRDGKSVIWRPIGDKVTVTVPARPGAKGVRGPVPPAVKARRKKLAAYLKTHETPTTDELMAVLDVPRKTVQEDMAHLGWWIRKGRGATWRHGTRPLRIVDTPTENPTTEPPEDTMPATEPIAVEEPTPEPVVPTPAVRELQDRADRAAQTRAEAEPIIAEMRATLPAPEPEPAPVSGEWRDVPDPEEIKHQSLAAIRNMLAPFGLEMRIQIRERRD